MTCFPATRAATLLALLMSGAVAPAFGQSAPLITVIPGVRRAAPVDAANVPVADLRVDVPLVLIPVHVTTPVGASVTNLNRQQLRLFEDGVEQRVTHFSQEDAPLSIGLVFDSSGSMQNKIRRSSEAAAAFFKTANPEDEFFLVEFSERPKLSVPFTRDGSMIYQRIARAHPVGRTSLLDAVQLALSQMKKAKNLRKAIVILSDGGDNRSRYTESEVKQAMREADVQVYAMGIFDSGGTRKRAPEELNGPRLLGELSEETGGRHFPVKNLDDLPGICARIGNELRDEYVLGYSPANAARDGKYRRVKVILAAPADMPPLKAYYRQGYYAPASP